MGPDPMTVAAKALVASIVIGVVAGCTGVGGIRSTGLGRAFGDEPCGACAERASHPIPDSGSILPDRGVRRHAPGAAAR